MNVLVTGGAGFIGSNLVDALLRQAGRVTVIDDLSTGRRANLPPEVTLYRQDIADGEALAEILRQESPEVVFHLAAQISVPRSLAEPGLDAGTNIVGTLNLLEACRLSGTRKVIYSSSAAVYGTPESLPVREDHPCRPLSPYGISKFSAELYLATYRHLYGLDYTILRYANVYGPRQEDSGEGGVVAVFIRHLLDGRPPVIYGDGEQTRDFIYVGDVVAANLQAIDRGAGQVLNISRGAPTSVNALLDILQRIAGTSLAPRREPPRPGDIVHSYLDNSRARRELAWGGPACGLEEGLRQTLEYCRRTSR